MVALKTPKVDLGWQAPQFELPATDGNSYSLSDLCGQKGLVVMFISNHCPYVQAILDKIVRDTNALLEYGVGSVAIMSNNVKEYPADSFDNMKQLADEKGFSFPYLYDETQGVAKAYDAVCTPDFFGFNADLQLQYRGRLDDAGRDPNPNASRELYEAMLNIAKTGRGPENQFPSIGCSIKWK